MHYGSGEPSDFQLSAGIYLTTKFGWGKTQHFLVYLEGEHLTGRIIQENGY
jgi:hypothetical protein